MRFRQVPVVDLEGVGSFPVNRCKPTNGSAGRWDDGKAVKVTLARDQGRSSVDCPVRLPWTVPASNVGIWWLPFLRPEKCKFYLLYFEIGTL